MDRGRRCIRISCGFRRGGSGDPYRLVATPYPGGDATYENPSLYTGSTLTSWVVPAGVVNPLERPEGSSYLSDPDMVYDPDAGELRIYYRRVTTHNEISMIRSSNGVVWSAPVLTVSAPNHYIVSPTIVRRSATQWLMWSVNSGTHRLRVHRARASSCAVRRMA